MSTGLHLAVEVRHADGAWQHVADDLPGIHDSYTAHAILADARQPALRVPPWHGWYSVEDAVMEAGATASAALCARVVEHLRAGMYPPIARPRGLPADAAPQTRAEATSSRDWHGHTWVTLAELQAYPWEDLHRSQEHVPVRLVDRARAVGYRVAYDEACAAGQIDAAALFVQEDWIDVETAVPYRIRAHHLYDETLPALATYGPPQDVRLVVWLDC